MKKCFKCNIEKPLADFYKHGKMADGHLGKCKSCTKIDVSKNSEQHKNDPGWIENERARGREKYHRYKYKTDPVKHKKYMLSYNQNYPEKYKAKNLSQRLPCDPGNQLHHWSYNIEHAKDVIELSVSDHAKAHRFLIYDQEFFMYRRIDTMELLDTRESHESYINYVIENKL